MERYSSETSLGCNDNILIQLIIIILMPMIPHFHLDTVETTFLFSSFPQIDEEITID